MWIFVDDDDGGAGAKDGAIICVLVAHGVVDIENQFYAAHEAVSRQRTHRKQIQFIRDKAGNTYSTIFSKSPRNNISCGFIIAQIHNKPNRRLFLYDACFVSWSLVCLILCRLAKTRFWNFVCNVSQLQVKQFSRQSSCGRWN